MRITVCIPSRGRPWILQEAVTTLCLRASGRHAIKIVIGCDTDDSKTVEASCLLRLRGWPVVDNTAPRSGSLGAMVDRMAEAHPADVYLSLADDTICLTDGWDDAIHEAWQKRPDAVWWWQATSTYAIVSEKWRQAAGRIFTDHFPFWGDDIYLAQVWRFASGEQLNQLPIRLADRESGTLTHRMRDLPFWIDFFWRLQGERINKARAIAGKLGWPVQTEIRRLEMIPNPAFMAHIDGVEEARGDKGPPTPEYLRIKARAEAMSRAA